MNKHKGFTLVELMITVAVVAILAAIALPSYLEQVKKGKRSDAKQALLAASEAIERYKAANFTYKLGDAGTTLSRVFAEKVPVDGGESYYSLTVVSSATGYTLTATPENSMAGDCVLTINNAGVRGKGTGDCTRVDW